MELKYTTTSRLEHKTTIKPDVKATDGGKAWLVEAFTFIRSQQQVGELTVQFGPGGSISSMSFKESTPVAQKELDFVTETE
jgi:hypothetical protein